MLTPADCEEELRRLCNKLEERTDALGKLLTDAAERDYEYRQAYAEAQLKVAEGELDTPSLKPTVAEKDAVVTTHIAGHTKLHLRSKAEAQACLEVVRSLRDQISAVQSANANVRGQAGLT